MSMTPEEIDRLAIDEFKRELGPSWLDSCWDNASPWVKDRLRIKALVKALDAAREGTPAETLVEHARTCGGCWRCDITDVAPTPREDVAEWVDAYITSEGISSFVRRYITCVCGGWSERYDGVNVIPGGRVGIVKTSPTGITLNGRENHLRGCEKRPTQPADTVPAAEDVVAAVDRAKREVPMPFCERDGRIVRDLLLAINAALAPYRAARTAPTNTEDA